MEQRHPKNVLVNRHGFKKKKKNNPNYKRFEIYFIQQLLTL